MGPAAESTSSSSTVKVSTLPKLKEDGSNWITYKERILNTLTSKGLKRHVTGSARKPTELIERSGDYYKPNSLSPLSDDQLEEHEKEVDIYDQKQAQVREVIYETISKSTFLQIKSQPSAAAVWKTLVSIHEEKGGMVQTDI
ncbi:hypothetical protein B0H34DRAFT_659656, partial [Crassisporium funariophilum]